MLTTAENIVLDKAEEFGVCFWSAKNTYYDCLDGNLRHLMDTLCVEMEACEAYDEDWFPLVATKGIADNLDWDKLNRVMAKRLLERYQSEFFDLFIQMAQATPEDEERLRTN